GGHMTDTQLRDEAITIFLAGHETTANALTWTWYVLSQHPEIYERVHQEVDRTLHGRLPTADDFARLRLVEMVLTEAMRLYPPVWGKGARCSASRRGRRIQDPCRCHAADEPLCRPPRCALLPRSFSF